MLEMLNLWTKIEYLLDVCHTAWGTHVNTCRHDKIYVEFFHISSQSDFHVSSLGVKLFSLIIGCINFDTLFENFIRTSHVRKMFPPNVFLI
jgi:hypothetical protein